MPTGRELGTCAYPMARGGPNELIDSSTKTVAKVKEIIQQNGRKTGRTITRRKRQNFQAGKTIALYRITI